LTGSHQTCSVNWPDFFAQRTASTARNGKAQWAVIDVADDGPGLPQGLEIVFERFHKGTSASPRAGLGLAIVRQVARTHNGDVGFLPGPGCRIRVSLPAGDGSSDGGCRSA
jgi:signal transduction histidine kinase